MKKYYLLLIILIIFCIYGIQIRGETPTAKINITEYSEEILIERGWMKYSNIIVKNVGNEELHNVTISVEGIHPEWFEVQTNKTSLLSINETSTFILKLSIPSTAETESYYFSLTANSDEVSDKKNFTVRVFKSRTELMFYEIQILRDDIEVLGGKTDDEERIGMGVTAVRDVLNEAEYLLDAAKNQVNNSMYNAATETINEVKDLIKKADYELSVVSPIPHVTILGIPWELFLVGIILGLIILLYLIREVLKNIHFKIPGPKVELHIKKLILDGRKLKNLEEEFEELRESQNLIEEEYREGMLSEESYEELRLKYQEKLLDLESKKKKIRGY